MLAMLSIWLSYISGIGVISGTDTKAGGPDYPLFFTQGQAIGERL